MCVSNLTSGATEHQSMARYQSLRTGSGAHIMDKLRCNQKELRNEVVKKSNENEYLV